jgi:thiol-disulfide isomerase/thioredoxin
MRRALLAAALALAMNAPAQAASKVGRPAPVFELALLDGGRLSSKSLAGQVVIVHFWATWCAPCRLEMPVLDAWARAHPGVKLIAVSLDDPVDPKAIRQAVKDFSFIEALAKGSTLGFDPVLPLPSTFLIDRKGILRKAGWRGTPHLDAAALDAVVAPLLK